jgi:hypothetical protein
VVATGWGSAQHCVFVPTSAFLPSVPLLTSVPLQAPFGICAAKTTLLFLWVLCCPIQAESLRAEEAARGGADAPILAVHLNRTFSALAGGSSRVSGWCVSGWVGYRSVQHLPIWHPGLQKVDKSVAGLLLCLKHCLQTSCLGLACKRWPVVYVG